MSDFDLSFLFNNPQENEFDNPKKFADSIGVDYGDSDTNYGDNSNQVLGSLNPSGSVVSGSKEDMYNRYKKILEERPAGEGYLQNYLARRPRFQDYEPDSKTKLIAAVMGGVTALNKGGLAGIEAAQKYRNAPFDQSVKEYTDEGKYVDDAMRLMNSDQERKLKGLQFEITSEETARSHKDAEAFKRMQMGNLENERSRVNEDRLRRDQDRDASRLDRENQNNQLNVFKNIALGLSRDRLDERKLVDQERNDRLRYGNGPGFPNQSQVNSSLREHVMSDPLGFGSIFDFPSDANGNKKLNAQPVPKWMIENRNPTPNELLKYNEYMRQIKNPNTDIDQLGFGSYR